MIEWQRSGPEPGKDDSDTRYHRAQGIAPITINRPEVRNTLPPDATSSLLNTFNIAEADAATGVIILTGARPFAHRGSLLPVWRG